MGGERQDSMCTSSLSAPQAFKDGLVIAQPRQGFDGLDFRRSKDVLFLMRFATYQEPLEEYVAQLLARRDSRPKVTHPPGEASEMKRGGARLCQEVLGNKNQHNINKHAHTETRPGENTIC